VSAYPSEFELGSDGFYPVSVVWLGDPGFQNNFRVSYAKSEDFRTRFSHDGTELPMPLRPDTMDTVHDIGPNGGLMNNAKISVADDGTPFITYTKYTENGLNGAYLAYPAGAEWESELLAESLELTPIDRKKTRGRLPTASPVRFRNGRAVVNVRFPGEEVVRVRIDDIGVSTAPKEPLPAGLKGDPIFADVEPLLKKPAFITSVPDDAEGNPTPGVRFVSLAQQPHRDRPRPCEQQRDVPECDPPPSPLLLLVE
jgi:hypothetical protein